MGPLQDVLQKGAAPPALHKFGITFREATLLEWAAAGKTNKEIAFILGISRRTVEKHLERIYEKLGVKTKIAALAMIMNSDCPKH
jgi:DNA-binding CsgD family transcriptional regulator